ncbi:MULTISPECIES: transposase [Streptomyces]|uniref:transposase n=2 Tax=Streptomyces TaxID=1883 RepID=UPI0002ABC58C|nr:MULTISPECIES: transposase [Streptomyces]
MCRVPLRGRHDLMNAQWAKLEPLLPVGKKPGRPPVHTKRQLIDGIPWRTRAGTAWRDVPERYGPWQTVYQLSGPERCGSSSRSPAHSRAGGKTGTSVRRAGRPPPAAGPHPCPAPHPDHLSLDQERDHHDPLSSCLPGTWRESVAFRPDSAAERARGGSGHRPSEHHLRHQTASGKQVGGVKHEA